MLIYLDGGLDSFNMIVPHSNCAGGVDMYTQYKEVRGETLALSKDTLKQITTATGSQVCDTWGIHPSLPFMQQLYNEGDASFVANIGSLIEPLTMEEYKLGEKSIPTQLFSHNAQTKQAQSVHPQYTASKGVLGRMVDALKTQVNPYRSSAFSLAGNVKSVEGSEAATMIDKRNGITRFTGTADVGAKYKEIAQRRSASVFGDTWGMVLDTALEMTETLGDLLDGAAIATDFDDTEQLAMQLKQVARLISQRDVTGAEREVYAVQLGGFDTHADEEGDLAASTTSNPLLRQ